MGDRVGFVFAGFWDGDYFGIFEGCWEIRELYYYIYNVVNLDYGFPGKVFEH